MGTEAFCKGEMGVELKKSGAPSATHMDCFPPTLTILGSKQPATAEGQTLKADGPLPPQTSYSAWKEN